MYPSTGTIVKVDGDRQCPYRGNLSGDVWRESTSSQSLAQAFLRTFSQRRPNIHMRQVTSVPIPTTLHPDIYFDVLDIYGKIIDKYSNKKYYFRYPQEIEVNVPIGRPDFFEIGKVDFFKELDKYLSSGLKGQYIAYLDGERVGSGKNDAELVQLILDQHGRPPDFIGYVNEKGIEEIIALNGL